MLRFITIFIDICKMAVLNGRLLLSVKSLMKDFCADCLLCTSVRICITKGPGHSTVGVPKRCRDFVAIWLRAREELADNRIFNSSI